MAQVDPHFADAVRDLLSDLASGGEPAAPRGGGLERVLREASPLGTRAAVAVLADRWFRAPPPDALNQANLPLLNRADIGEAEKVHALLADHLAGQRRWQELSSNESTFYRYRRQAIAAFLERLWSEIANRPFPSNRPRPEYRRFVGRRQEVSQVLRLLVEPGGTVAGVEGPGGSGKTALMHAVADACEAAARSWTAVSLDEGTCVPIFDGLVWVARAGDLDLAALLDTVARTLDYPGILARALEDRRQAVRDLLARRALLLVVDDADLAAPAVLTFLGELPGPSRALVAGRRRLPAEVRALLPAPLSSDEVRELLLAEAERQGAPNVGRALVEGSAAEPLQAAARYPLLASWAVGQLRRGQTVERVRERLQRAEGDVFEAMFAASVAGLSVGPRNLLATLPLLAAPAHRATLLAAGGSGAELALDELLETSLLEVSGEPTDEARRYGLHAVTRSFVEARLPLDAQAHRAAVARLAEHFANLAETWGGPAHRWRSFGRLEAELPNLMAVTEAASLQAREREGIPPGPVFDVAVLSLAHGMRNVFWFGRSWAEGRTLFHRAIEAAKRLGDVRAEGWNTYRLAALHYELGTAAYGEAAQRARQAADLLRTAGDRRGQGHAMRLLGRAVSARGNVPEAERLLGDAERLLAQYGHGDDMAIVRSSHADLLRLTGRLDKAAAMYEAVLAAGLDDPGTEANVHNDLGEIAYAQGRVDEAQLHLADAERLAVAAGARAIVARARLGQARIALQAGRLEDARRLADSAADQFERLGDLERTYEARALLDQPQTEAVH